MSFLAKGQAGSLQSPGPKKGSARLRDGGAGADSGDRAHAPQVTGSIHAHQHGLDTSGRDKGNREVECLNLWQPNTLLKLLIIHFSTISDEHKALSA